MDATKLFTEIGLDFDNNKYGFGISSEVESKNIEIRRIGFIRMKPSEVYLRIWLLKKVLIVSTKEGIKLNKKQRKNFKILIGVAGKAT